MTIVGIDEVGRGCLAGPLVMVAVIIDEQLVPGLRDSKLLSKKRRNVLAAQIKQHATSIGIGWVSAKRIDDIGLSTALKFAARQALSQITAPYDSVIIDGTVNFIEPSPALTMKQADKTVLAVSAASIVAKVARDTYMQAADAIFPEFNFKTHVGYGTATHLSALKKYGPSPLHRMSFAPLNGGEVAIKPTSGHSAETAACDYLRVNGYTVIDRNWKTKWCEIDIITSKSNRLYFVEVKYRRNGLSGKGFDYITKQKLNQMKFAAELWVKQQRYSGPYQLAAIELQGDPISVTRFEPQV